MIVHIVTVISICPQYGDFKADIPVSSGAEVSIENAKKNFKVILTGHFQAHCG